MNYGDPIAGGWFDFAPRIKNRILTSIQDRVLLAFNRLSNNGGVDKVFAQGLRRFVGAHLYALKVEVNTGCNLSCKMCYVKREGRELPAWIIAKLFRDLKDSGVHLEFLGGEPLLRKDIIELVAAAKQSIKSKVVTMYTNGTLATPETARQLKAAGLDVAIITLVSDDEKDHDAFVGRKGSWARTLNGIRAFKDAGVATYTFSCIHAANYKKYKKIHEFVQNVVGVKALFYPYIPQRKDDPLMIDPKDWRKIKRWVLYDMDKEHGVFIRDFFMLTGNSCAGGNYMLFVKSDGILYPCPFVDDIPLGDLSKANIWSLYRRRFENPQMKTFKSSPSECQGCSHESVCAGGCRAGNHKLFGTYSVRDHRCLGPYRKSITCENVCDCIPSFF